MLAAALSGRLNIGGCAWDAQLFPSSIMVALLSVLPEQSLLQHTISTEKFPISKKRCRSPFNFLPNTLRYPFAALPLSRQDHAPLYNNRSLGAECSLRNQPCCSSCSSAAARTSAAGYPCSPLKASSTPYCQRRMPAEGETPRCPPILPRHVPHIAQASADTLP